MLYILEAGNKLIGPVEFNLESQRVPGHFLQGGNGSIIGTLGYLLTYAARTSYST